MLRDLSCVRPMNMLDGRQWRGICINHSSHLAIDRQWIAGTIFVQKWSKGMHLVVKVEVP